MERRQGQASEEESGISLLLLLLVLPVSTFLAPVVVHVLLVVSRCKPL
jgi:hypothetical protein